MALFGGRKRVSTAASAAVETRSLVGPDISLSDPALMEYLGLGGYNDAGVPVTEASSLGFTAVWRAVSIISGTIAGLPLKSYRNVKVKVDDGEGEVDGIRRVQTPSFLDNPGGSWLTPFELKEIALVHLLLHGNAYLLHVLNGAGSVDSLMPIHPSCVTVEWDKKLSRRTYEITGMPRPDGDPFTEAHLTHVMGLGTDGLKGLSPITVARNAIGTGLAGDQAAARMFSSGMLIGGLVTPKEDLDPDQATEAITDLKARISGVRNAGDLVLANAALSVQPWTMSAEDAQFIQTRAHQIEDVARIFGVPPHLLAQTEKQTSWGSGVESQNRGLARYTLAPWTSRLEQRLSRLLPQPRFCEFEYAGLVQASPEDEIRLLIEQVNAGLLLPNEARAIRNLPPIPGGDVMRAPAAKPPATPTTPAVPAADPPQEGSE